jgi:phasin family protein
MATAAKKITDTMAAQAATFNADAKTAANDMMAQGKAAFEQASVKSREIVEKGVKSVEELTEFAKGNVEALVASNKAAVAGFEAAAQTATEFAKASVEKATVAAKTMTAAKTPNEFFQVSNDFAKAQFDATVAEMSKNTETMMKMMGDVFAPLSNRVAIAADKMKSSMIVR